MDQHFLVWVLITTELNATKLRRSGQVRLPVVTQLCCYLHNLSTHTYMTHADILVHSQAHPTTLYSTYTLFIRT